MLTPVFQLSQTEGFVVVKIRAPFAKVRITTDRHAHIISLLICVCSRLFQVSETEILIEGREILFSSKPYYLRLYLDSEVTEDGQEKADYDADSGTWLSSIKSSMQI